MYVELKNEEITLRPFSYFDRAKWKSVRASNREWLGPWDATVPKTSKHAKSSGTLSFARMVRMMHKEAGAGRAFSFAIFKGPNLIGQINLGGVVYGALRGAHIGYWIDRNYANRGFISAAVNMVVDFAFKELELHRIELCIRPENQPSIRVAEKCGFVYEGFRPRFLHIDKDWRDHNIYVRLNPEIK